MRSSHRLGGVLIAKRAAGRTHRPFARFLQSSASMLKAHEPREASKRGRLSGADQTRGALNSRNALTSIPSRDGGDATSTCNADDRSNGDAYPDASPDASRGAYLYADPSGPVVERLEPAGFGPQLL